MNGAIKQLEWPNTLCMSCMAALNNIFYTFDFTSITASEHRIFRVSLSSR